MLHELDNVVIFDGACKLCTHSVTFILRHEADQILRFAPLQSPAGMPLMQEFGIDPAQMKTFPDRGFLTDAVRAAQPEG